MAIKNDTELAGMLKNKLLTSVGGGTDSDLNDVRKENLNYYVGKEYGNEREGYSKFVTREVLETVEWVLPSVLRTFLSGDQIGSFDATGPEDEEQAQLETEVVNHCIMRKNRGGEGGFTTLYTWMKDAIMNPNGYVEVAIEKRETTETGVVEGINPVGLGLLEDDKDIEIMEQEEVGTDGDVPLFNVRVRQRKEYNVLAVSPVPPEQMIIDSSLTSPNLDDSEIVGRRFEATYTELVKDGVDQKTLDKIPSTPNSDEGNDGDEETNRMFYAEEESDTDESIDESMRRYVVHKLYVMVDYDGDGVAELRYIRMVGETVVDNEPVSFQPFISMSSILMQHKHTGMSYVDTVKDLQLLSSVLTRNLLDNIYRINLRRKVFSESALLEDGSTMEAIMNTQAEYIPVRGMAQNAFAAEPSPSLVSEILPVIKHVDMARVNRTGVSPDTSVDASALQEVRQDVFNNALERASQRVEMLVRVFAETGYRQLMLKVHQLLRDSWGEGLQVKLRGDWVNVDPSLWPERTNLTIEVGLGYSTKQQRIMILQNILAMQKESLPAGLADMKRIHNTMSRIVNASDIGDPSTFFIDPQSPEYQPPEPPPPPPEAMLAQAQAQALGLEQQRKAAEAQQKAQLDATRAQAEIAARQAESARKDHELLLKERELLMKIDASAKDREEIEQRIENIEADTQVKRAQADKTMAEAAATAVEVSETYQQALKMVSESGEMNDEDEGPDNAEEGGEEETDAGTES